MRRLFKTLISVALSSWSAAVFSTAGVAAPGCTVYIGENLTDDHIDVPSNEIDLTLRKHNVFGNWNDEISSIRVWGGICRVFEDVDFHGTYRDLKKGVYNNANEIGLADNTISSIEVRAAPSSKVRKQRKETSQHR